MKKKLLKNNIRNLRFFKSKLIGTLLVVLIFLSQNLMAQGASINEDQLVAKCLTFQPLQDVIPTEVKAQMATYQVLNNDVSSKIPSTLTVEGKLVSLISNSKSISSKTYFVFNTLSINNKGDLAMAEYDFIYKKNDVEKVLSVTVEFKKEASKWQQFNYYISN